MTIQQIARELGLSTATVSNVIHGKLGKMSAETARRVREKLEQYQYVPNMGARMLAMGGSHIIAVVFCYPIREDKSAFQDTFVAEMLGSLENEIRTHGYFMMPYVARNAEEICRIAQTWNADGMIVWGIMPEECRKLNDMMQKPIVFVDCYFESDKPICNIGSDDYKGGRMAARHLIKAGHRNIAFLCDSARPIGVDAQRFAGYREALREAGISFREDLFVPLHQSRQAQRAVDQRLAERIREGELSALFYASDYYAALGLSALRDLQIDVPGECSVVGYDDSILAQMAHPRLTSIHQNITEKARRAAELLIRLNEYPDTPRKSHILSVSIAKRASVLPLS